MSRKIRRSGKRRPPLHRDEISTSSVESSLLSKLVPSNPNPVVSHYYSLSLIITHYCQRKTGTRNLGQLFFPVLTLSFSSLYPEQRLLGVTPYTEPTHRCHPREWSPSRTCTVSVRTLRGRDPSGWVFFRVFPTSVCVGRGPDGPRRAPLPSGPPTSGN